MVSSDYFGLLKYLVGAVIIIMEMYYFSALVYMINPVEAVTATTGIFSYACSTILTTFQLSLSFSIVQREITSQHPDIVSLFSPIAC